MADPNELPPQTASHELVARRLGDRDDWAAAVEGRDQLLGAPHGTCDWPRHLLERNFSEQVVTDDQDRRGRVDRRVERDLVETLDDDVVAPGPGFARARPRDLRIVGAYPAQPPDLDPVEDLALRGAPPARDELCHLMASRRQPAEDLVDVDLSTPGVRVKRVSLVEDEDAEETAHRFYSLPSQSAIRSHQQIHRPSIAMPRFSFEVPRVRSTKKKGSSLTRAPFFTKR